MNAYELAEYLKAFVDELTDYDKDYHIHAAQVLILQAHEVKSLREQLISATNALMEIKRWTLATSMPFTRAKWAVRKLNEAGTG